MSATVVIYNLGGAEVLGRTSVQHAILMLHKQKAKVHTAIPGKKFGPYDLPAAVELLHYVVAKWKYRTTGRVPFSKRGVLKRDNFTCAYCGRKADTVDHVLPKWQGNALTWNNAVAACLSCNAKKAGRSPQEAGMKLRFQPSTPTFEQAYRWSHRG